MPKAVPQDAGQGEIRISVVIPTLNEARNIPFVLRSMPECVDEIVLVDGRSVDGTIEAALAVRPDALVVHQGRRGKGNALAAGLAAAHGHYVVLMDADGSMDPGEVVHFVAALEAGADYVKGTRFRAPGGSSDITVLRRAGNAGLNILTNLLYGTRFTDLCYGYNAVRRSCLGAFALPDPHERHQEPVWGDGFEVETLINIRAAKAGLVIEEVGSFEHPRRYGVSNLHTFRDGLRVLRTIVRERDDRSRLAVLARRRRRSRLATAARGALRGGMEGRLESAPDVAAPSQPTALPGDSSQPQVA